MNAFGWDGAPPRAAPRCGVCSTLLERGEVEEIAAALQPRSPPAPAWRGMMYARQRHQVWRCPKCKGPRAVGPP